MWVTLGNPVGDSKGSASPLASGRTADVYRAAPGTVVKLFQTWISEAYVASERNKASAVHSMGLPTPAVGELVRQGGRLGILFEEILGSSMLEQLNREPDSLEPLARRMARLHRSVHERRAPEAIPPQRALLAEKISRSELLRDEQRQALLDRLARLPDGDRLCHGDFHPGNIMLTERGPTIIDWADACRGNPAADVARTSILIFGYVENVVADESVRTSVRRFHQTYLDAYFEHDSDLRTEYRDWLPVMAAARLSDRMEAAEEAWLLDRIRQGFEEAVGS